MQLNGTIIRLTLVAMLKPRLPLPSCEIFPTLILMLRVSQRPKSHEGVIVSLIQENPPTLM